ncbi:MAG: alkaline phosphatase family protein [Planctomycetes bacterium]|nr:alkaline phosphatase family protein [Planctomycetota bacterium]
MRIVSLALMLSAVLGGALPAQEEKKERHVVLISIDGLRPEFYLGDGFDAPTLKAMAKEGASAKAVESVYPSVTYAGHASIVTGVRPWRHGVVANTKFGENGGTQEWFWETKDLKAKTVWQLAHDAGRKTAITAWPSSVGAQVDWLVPERWAVFKGETTEGLLGKHSTPGLLAEMALAIGVPKGENLKSKEVMDEFISSGAAYVLRKYKPHLLLVHLIQVDEAQHNFGRDAPEVHAAVKATDANVAKIRKGAELAGILDRTDFVIVGDHGFADAGEALAPNTLLASAGLLDADGTKVKSWKALGHAHGGSMAVYAKDADSAKMAREVLEKGATADGKRLYSILDRRQLDDLGYNSAAALALEAEDGFMFASTSKGSLTGHKPWSKGQHGHLPTKPKLATGFIASGPGIRRVLIERMRVIDVAPTVAAMLGLEMKEVEGAKLDIIE